jgi:hypothetical protein
MRTCELTFHLGTMYIPLADRRHLLHGTFPPPSPLTLFYFPNPKPANFSIKCVLSAPSSSSHCAKINAWSAHFLHISSFSCR